MKRHDPQVLKLFGLTEEEANNPGAALLSEGVKKLHRVVQFMKLPEDLDAERRWSERAVEHKTLPLWQSMTGLTPNSEDNMSPEKREEALEELIKIVLHLLRYELKAEAESPREFHTAYWDPLPKVCSALGLARTELSRLSRAGCGLVAHELVDVVRVKAVKDIMKERVREFMAVLNAPREPGEKFTPPTTANGIHKMLLAARRGPHFHRGQWALTFNFPNHARFHRACLVFYKLAPQQLELLVIEELLKEMKAERAAESNATETASEKPRFTVYERLKAVVWDQLKAQHVQFFAEREKAWAS